MAESEEVAVVSPSVEEVGPARTTRRGSASPARRSSSEGGSSSRGRGRRVRLAVASDESDENESPRKRRREPSVGDIKFLKTIPPLRETDDEGRPVDLAEWFLNFEEELSTRASDRPKDMWADQLSLQVTGEFKPLLQDARARVRHDRPQAAGYELYCGIRDAILDREEASYGVLAVARKMMSIPPGLNALTLELKIRRLSWHFDRAVERLKARGLINFFEPLSEGWRVFCFLRALDPRVVQRMGAALDRAASEKQPFSALVRRAAEIEPEFTSTPIVAAIRPERRERKARSPDYGSPDRGDRQRSGRELRRKSRDRREQGGARSFQKERKGASPVSKSSQGGACFHCGQEGHELLSCARWRERLRRQPSLKRCCPKCLRPGHQGRTCRETEGLLWEVYKPKERLNSAVTRDDDASCNVLLTHSPLSSTEKGGRTGCSSGPPSVVEPGEESSLASVGRGWAGALQDPEASVAAVGLAAPASSTQVLSELKAVERRALTLKRDFYIHRVKEHDEGMKQLNLGPELKWYGVLALPSNTPGHINVRLNVAGDTISAMLDSGSALTLLDEGRFPRRNFGGVTELASAVSVPTANGTPLIINATFSAIISVADRVAKVTVLLCHGLRPHALLGLSTFHALRDFLVGDSGGRRAIFLNGQIYRGDENFPEFFLTSETPVNSLAYQSELVCALPTFDDYEPADNDFELHLEDAYVAEAETEIATFLSQSAKENADESEDDSGRVGGASTPRGRPETVCATTGGASNPTAGQGAESESKPSTNAEIKRMVLRANLELGQRAQLLAVCQDYEEIFNAGDKPLALTNLTEFTIEIKKGATPKKAHPRELSLQKEELLRREVQKCLDAGVIQPSTSEWAAAAVLVMKRSGDVRLCLDYRPLNSVTIIPQYPLPRIRQALTCLQGKHYFSVFDFPSAYWQIPVAENSRKYTAFVTRDGLYEWVRMPFGASGAPATQQRMVDSLLAGMKWRCALAYLDDVVIFSNTLDEHLTHLKEFFERVKAANLQLKPQKSTLCATETKYLGFLVSAEGVRPDPKNTAAVERLPTPKSVKDVRSFLGIGSYYRRFVKDFARIAAPLQKLLRIDAKFAWGDAEQKAFNAIKTALTEATRMAHPKFGEQFTIDCDASGIGLGAVLSQKDERGAERPIAYASRALRPNEQKWPTTELEAFAVVWALEEFRVWIEGSPTLVRTDHSPLLWLRNNVGKSQRLARWVLRLQDFKYELQHRPGSCNRVADALSRYPQAAPEQPHSTMHDTPACATQVLCNAVNPRMRCYNCNADITVFSAEGGGRAQLEATAEDSDVEEIETDQEIPKVDPGPQTLREAQKTCPDCIEVSQYLFKAPGARLPLWACREQLEPCFVDDILCFKSQEEEKADDPPRILLPRAFRTTVVQRFHLTPTNGHPGRVKTFNAIKERYAWPGMKQDVERVLNACAQCWKNKPAGRIKRPPLSLPKGWPGEYVALDIFGKLPTTPRGNAFILVMIDHFSRWVEMVALQTVEAMVVAKAIRDNWIPRHGVPRVLLSDNGRSFVAAVIVRLCAAMGIKKIFSTPYRPQGNSVVESFMRTLKSGLRALVNEDGRDWDLHLHAVALAHNSTPSMATGYSPFFLEHGREAILPVQRHLDEPRLDPVSKRWLGRLWRARVACYQASMKEHEARKALVMTKGAKYPVGSVVAVKLTPNELKKLPMKFAPDFAGPYVIVTASADGLTYVCQHVLDDINRKVHRDQLKLLSLPPPEKEDYSPIRRARTPVSPEDARLAKAAQKLLEWEPPLYVVETTPVRRRAQEIVDEQARKKPSLVVGEARRPRGGS